MTIEVIQKIDDYDVNLSLFLYQFRNSTKLQGIIKAAHKSANDIETALFEIRDNFYLDSAIGIQLDILGIVFQEDRLSRDDDEYREALKIKGALNYSGEPEAIINIMNTVYGALFADYRPHYPGKFYMFTDAVLPYSKLNQFSPSGVQGYLEQFILDTEGNYILDANGNYLTCVNNTTYEELFLLDTGDSFILDDLSKFYYSKEF